MPIMELVLEQTFANQQIINRWNYLASGTPASVSFSFGLVSAFGAIESAGVYPVGGVLNLLLACQTTTVVSVQIGVRDVYSNTDFYELPFLVPANGQAAGEALSPTSAMGFRTNRTRTDIRRGTKRFVGVSENVNGAAGVLAGAFVDGNMTNLANAMSDTLEYDDEGNTLTFQPIICGREKYSPSGNPAGPFAYKYYDTEAEQLDHIMTSIIWSPYPEVRTQTSRQYGRGR